MFRAIFHLSRALTWCIVVVAISPLSCKPSSGTQGPTISQAKTPLPTFEMPTFGVPIAKVEELYPKGHSSLVGDGETHYRVPVQAFGHPLALATFCFKQKVNLDFVAVEFADTTASCDLRTGNYLRPTIAQAKELHGKLNEWLTGRYGLPSHTQGDPATGCLSVFGREHREFVRLDVVLAGTDRSNVVLWQENRVPDAPDSDADKGLVAGFWRSESSAWSNGAFFNVQWGMGPGDVKDRYKQLREGVLSHPYQPTQSYSAKDYIEGEDVTLDFTFFKGRLVGLTITPDLQSVDEGIDKHKLQQVWAGWERWRGRISEILALKYGQPREGHAQGLFSPALKPSDPPNAWGWKTDTALISIEKIGARSVLRYHETATLQAVEDAEEKHEQLKANDRVKKF